MELASAMSAIVFTYGTLMLSSGHIMGKKIASESDFLGPANVNAKLYDFGKWPGLALSSDPRDQVYGEAWKLRSDNSLQWIDEYEGIGPNIAMPEYERIQQSIKISGRGIATAFLYVYRWPIDYSRQITGGRWLHRVNPPLTIARPVNACNLAQLRR